MKLRYSVVMEPMKIGWVWCVKDNDVGRVVCECYEEQDAVMIANALNGGQSC